MRVTSALVHDHVEETGVLVGEAVVVLPPHGAGDEQVHGRDLRPPREQVADGQPLRMLVEHRIDDVGERLVGAEEPVAAGEHVALEHAFERVLAEHLDDAAVREFGAVRVFREVLLQPHLLGHFVNRLQLVGGVLVRAEDAEVRHVGLHDVAEEVAERSAVLGFDHAGLLDRDAVIAEIRQPQRFLEVAAVGVRIRADAAQGRSGRWP